MHGAPKEIFTLKTRTLLSNSQWLQYNVSATLYIISNRYNREIVLKVIRVIISMVMMCGFSLLNCAHRSALITLREKYSYINVSSSIFIVTTLVKMNNKAVNSDEVSQVKHHINKTIKCHFPVSDVLLFSKAESNLNLRKFSFVIFHSLAKITVKFV